MSSHGRWHRPDCSQPSIIVEDGRPRCHSCHATSLVLEKRLVDENRAKGGDIHLPVTLPLGKANLWWPPCVPYLSPQVDASTDSDLRIGGEGATIPFGRDTERSLVSPIYSSSLDSNHFRLIYLTESEDACSPIHLRLEEYAFNDHPEYETVSYVWGGENCDSILCKPVYVGRFWDVILVTANCSALLHYLRRRKVCRKVWVDAICINQADNTEKPAQVSRMSDIYSNCERVVAYFGEDLVSRPPGRTHRLRIDLQKSSFIDGNSPFENIMRQSTGFSEICADSAGICQDQLFERRYLTRIWIVQELLLSKKAIFPLGDLDILCDREGAMRLILRSSEERLDISAVKRSLTCLLQATSHCRASDPRDRVYGLLGLFEPQDFSEKLIPDYTISWRDCWVGTAAYLLLVERNLQLLTHALGNDRHAHLPSWVPDIVNMKPWELAPSSDSQDSISAISGRYLAGIGDQITPSGTWVTEFVMYSVKAWGSSPTFLKMSPLWGQQSHQLIYSDALCIESRESAKIDSSNGALQLKALRVFDRPCRLTTETEANGLTSIWVRGPSTAAHFRITGLKRPLVLEESYQLFLISCEDLTRSRSCESRSILLALTTAPSERDTRVVTIHDCCIVYNVNFYSMDHFEARMGRTDLMTNHLHSNHLHSLHWVLQILHGNFRTPDMKDLGDDWIFYRIFPSFAAKTREILPLLSRLLDPGSLADESPTLAESISAVAENICPEFDPVIRGNYFHLTIKNVRMWRDWSTANLNGDGVPFYMAEWTNRLEVNYSNPRPLAQDNENWSILDRVENRVQWYEFWRGPALPFTLRFSLDILLPIMIHSTIFKAMCYARAFSTLLDENFESPMAREPTPEDSCVFLEGWGRGLLDELGLVWKLERITIM